MGQKVNPNCFRLKVSSVWQSSWYSDDASYARKLYEDVRIRDLVFEDLKYASVDRVSIERPANKIIVNIYSAKPGVVIGKKGNDIADIKSRISKISSGEVVVNITEIRKPEIEPGLIARSIASQLEKRMSFRKVVKRAIASAMKMGAKGIKVNVSGRLGGAEIARVEWYREGRVPLHTMRAKVRYAFAEANTIYGVIGVKIWVYHGEHLQSQRRLNSNK